jgi:hypothetical protein
VGSSPAACSQVFKYGGPETGPKKHLNQPYPLNKRVVLCIVIFVSGILLFPSKQTKFKNKKENGLP